MEDFGEFSVGTVDESVKRKRGRPAKGGEPILVRLAPHERAIAESLGAGVVAEGIRLALVAAGQMGENAVRLLTAKVENPRPKDDNGKGN